MVWMARQTRQSSANRWHLVPGSRTDGRSLIKKIGQARGLGRCLVECQRWRWPWWSDSHRLWRSACGLQGKSRSTSRLVLVLHTVVSLLSSLPWGNLSKALLKSNTTMSAWCPSSLTVRRSCTVVNNCVLQDARKPCCSHEIIPCLLRWALMWLHMMCSSALHVTQVRLMGR